MQHLGQLRCPFSERSEKGSVRRHISSSSALATERIQQLTAGFASRGSSLPVAREQAMGVLDGAVRLQASVLSFGDMFHIVSIMFVCSIPLLLLLGNGRGAKPAPDSH